MNVRRSAAGVSSSTRDRIARVAVSTRSLSSTIDGSSCRDLNPLALRPAASRWAAASGAIGSSDERRDPGAGDLEAVRQAAAPAAAHPAGERQTLPTQTNSTRNEVTSDHPRRRIARATQGLRNARNAADEAGFVADTPAAID